MVQQGQVFPLASGHGGETRWAYRYRIGGRGSRRVQRGGFATEQAAVEALERALERLRREHGLVETPTLAEFVEIYLGQHGGEPRRPTSYGGCWRRRCGCSESDVSASCTRRRSQRGE
jgi:hypothetical protein